MREALPTQEDFEDEDDDILDTLGAKKDLWLNLGAPMVLNLNSRVGRKSKKKKKRNTNKTKRRRRRKK